MPSELSVRHSTNGLQNFKLGESNPRTSKHECRLSGHQSVRRPFHMFKCPHCISGECPAFDAFGVDLTRLSLGVAVDCHDLVLRVAVLREKVACRFANAVIGQPFKSSCIAPLAESIAENFRRSKRNTLFHSIGKLARRCSTCASPDRAVAVSAPQHRPILSCGVASQERK